VKHLGRVDDEVLDVLYRRALALVFPSLHEGFGQPVVEAMQRGCPVVVARSGALPEVVGDAGVLIAPLDPIAWADAIDSLMQDDIRDPQRDLGLTRSQMWSAERTAAAQFAAYRHLCC
jgi:glycosyltransferase involved in cell wall biosynthesis